jgi:ATP-binding protein involved in chromosome partitioning
VLGVVASMSGPFGRGAGRTVAESLAVPFLGEVPFDDQIVQQGDAGMPTLIARPNGPSAAAFRAIARAVAAALGWSHAQGERQQP